MKTTRRTFFSWIAGIFGGATVATIKRDVLEEPFKRDVLEEPFDYMKCIPKELLKPDSNFESFCIAMRDGYPLISEFIDETGKTCFATLDDIEKRGNRKVWHWSTEGGHKFNTNSLEIEI